MLLTGCQGARVTIAARPARALGRCSIWGTTNNQQQALCVLCKVLNATAQPWSASELRKDSGSTWSHAERSGKPTSMLAR